jgi:hypothetical protein
MSTGKRAMLAIEFLIRSDAVRTQEKYENELSKHVKKFCLNHSLASPVAVTITLKQLRTLRSSERESKALAAFRANFPELNSQPDAHILELLGLLEGLERESGRLEVVKAKVLRSNIHTVLKPLDSSWNTRFGLDQMRSIGVSPELVQSRANELLEEVVTSESSLDQWERKVLDLFKDSLVYQGLDEKPIGTIGLRPFRLYRHNWTEWCHENRTRVMDTMNDRGVDLESKPRTRNYNLNSQLRKEKASNTHKIIYMQRDLLDRLQKQIYEVPEGPESSIRKAELIDLYKQNTYKLALLEKELQVERELESKISLSSASNPQVKANFKLVVRRRGFEDLEGEKVWRRKEDLINEIGPWLKSLQEVWDDSTSDLVISFESETEAGANKVMFGTSSLSNAADKIKLLTD